MSNTLSNTLSNTAQESPRTIVERARERADGQERKRTRSSATEVAVARTAALQRRTGLRRFAFENGLCLVAFGLFALSLTGQILAGRNDYNNEQQQHGQPTVGLGAYLRTGAFVEVTAENWESEFLQMGLFVLLTAFLYQRGSSESKGIEEPQAVDQDPREARDDPDAPWPVRRGGVPLVLYENSLTIVLLLLFVISFTLHAFGGARAYNDQAREHGEAAISTIAFLGTSQFWYQSFQNWQSEFFSVGVLVLASIWLRQRGSAQSKPVAAAVSDTGA